MADYPSLKVPDLRKILQERGLLFTGNKADLVARLQEDDGKKAGTGAAAGEDEIDWDEDDKAAAPAPIPAVAEAPKVPEPAPATTTEAPKTEIPAPAPAPATAETTTEEAPAPKTAPDYSIGLSSSDAQKEAEKRAARAKRFGIPESEEAKKLAERAKKFGVAAEKDPVVTGLDSALPERRQKRAREEKGNGKGRDAKRQTPDRRTEPKKAGEVKKVEKKPLAKITDDPNEKAKAEARAKRFAKAPTGETAA